jgi:hypothetical protein
MDILRIVPRDKVALCVELKREKYDNDGSLQELVKTYDDNYGKKFSIACMCIEGGAESLYGGW